MAYQGEYAGGWMYQLGIPGRSQPDLVYQNLTDNMLAMGIAYSNNITTVSPRYAVEIQYPYMGYGLDGLIRTRANDLFGEIGDAQSFAVTVLDVLHHFRHGGIILLAFVGGLQVLGNADDADDPLLRIPQRQLVRQAPPAAAGRVEVELKLVQHRFTTPQNSFVLSAVTFAERCGEQFIGAAADQFILHAAPTAFHQRLIHDDVFAAAVFDEEYQIGQAVE
jgi:hypothetical protein